jgi:4-hydroxybenzoate-CoA ligase
MASYNAAADFVDRNVQEGRGGKLAFADPTATLTYGALLERVSRVGPALMTLGLGPEDRVLMLVQDTIDFPVIFWGAMRAGIVPVPINTLLPADQVRYMLEDSRAKALFVSAPLVAVAEAAAAGLTHLRATIVVGEAASSHASLRDLLAQAPAAPKPVATHADETAFWLYSSGSTGMPKGARHLHSSLAATARLYGEGVLGIRSDDVCYSAAKLFFAYGLGNSMTFPMWVGASAFLYPERPTPPVILDILKTHKPTLFFGAPTLYAALLADPNCTPANGSPRLRQCVSAGEALPEHLGLEWKRRMGVDILDGIGSTEMLHIFMSNLPGALRYGTSGVPVPGYDVRLVDETDKDVADGEVGELLVSGPSSAEGYWNQRAKSRRTFQGEWTRTGDKYIRDPDGMYRYCGRTDDMFKVSGIWVSPFDVESALITHPAVLEAAVVAAEDDDGLLKPKAFVVLKDASGTKGAALAEDLKEHVKRTVGPWKYPRWIEIVDGLPKTATGKIQRFKLRGPDDGKARAPDQAQDTPQDKARASA